MTDREFILNVIEGLSMSGLIVALGLAIAVMVAS